MSQDKNEHVILAMRWLDEAKGLREEIRDTPEAAKLVDPWLRQMVKIRNAKWMGKAEGLEKAAREIGEFYGTDFTE